MARTRSQTAARRRAEQANNNNSERRVEPIAFSPLIRSLPERGKELFKRTCRLLLELTPNQQKDIFYLCENRHLEVLDDMISYMEKINRLTLTWEEARRESIVFHHSINAPGG